VGKWPSGGKNQKQNVEDLGHLYGELARGGSKKECKGKLKRRERRVLTLQGGRRFSPEKREV